MGPKPIAEPLEANPGRAHPIKLHAEPLIFGPSGIPLGHVAPLGNHRIPSPKRSPVLEFLEKAAQESLDRKTHPWSWTRLKGPEFLRIPGRAVKPGIRFTKGPILCFVGPSGWARLSWADIARAMKRKFHRISWAGCVMRLRSRTPPHLYRRHARPCGAGTENHQDQQPGLYDG